MRRNPKRRFMNPSTLCNRTSECESYIVLFRHYLRCARYIEELSETFSLGIKASAKFCLTYPGIVSGCAEQRGRIRPGPHLLFTGAANGTVLRPLVCSLPRPSLGPPNKVLLIPVPGATLRRRKPKSLAFRWWFLVYSLHPPSFLLSGVFSHSRDFFF